MQFGPTVSTVVLFAAQIRHGKAGGVTNHTLISILELSCELTFLLFDTIGMSTFYFTTIFFHSSVFNSLFSGRGLIANGNKHCLWKRNFIKVTKDCKYMHTPQPVKAHSLSPKQHQLEAHRVLYVNQAMKTIVLVILKIRSFACYFTTQARESMEGKLKVA